jgi:hypothetical protein
MKKLARMGMLVCVPLLALCILAMWFGRTFAEPTDARVADMDYCEGSPCLLGVIPGITLWTTAQIDLSGLPDGSVSARRIIIPVDENTEVQLFPSVNGITVGRIYINLDRPLDAGWLVQRFGKPCGVSIYFEAHMVTLRYPFMLANIELEDERLQTDMPVSFIQFADPDFRLKKQPDLCVDTVTTRQVLNAPWGGFRSIRQYVAGL